MPPGAITSVTPEGKPVAALAGVAVVPALVVAVVQPPSATICAGTGSVKRGVGDSGGTGVGDRHPVGDWLTRPRRRVVRGVRLGDRKRGRVGGDRHRDGDRARRVAVGLASQNVKSPGAAVAVLVIVPPWKAGSTVTVMVNVATPNGSRVRATPVMSPGAGSRCRRSTRCSAAQVQEASMRLAGIVSLNARRRGRGGRDVSDLDGVGEGLSRLRGGVAGHLGDGDRRRLQHLGGVGAGAGRVGGPSQQLVFGPASTVAVLVDRRAGEAGRDGAAHGDRERVAGRGVRSATG